jgi:hypothetical protein
MNAEYLEKEELLVKLIMENGGPDLEQVLVAL